MNRRRQATRLLATSARTHARTSVLGLRPPFVAQEFVVEYVGEYISAAEAERRSYAGSQLQPHPGQQMGAPRLPVAHACGALCRPRTLSPVAGEYMMELPGRGNGGGKAGVVTIDAFAMRNIAAWHAARGLPNPEAQQACARALRPLTNAGPCRRSINFSCDPNLTMDPVTAAHGAATPRLASASPFPHSGPRAVAQRRTFAYLARRCGLPARRLFRQARYWAGRRARLPARQKRHLKRQTRGRLQMRRPTMLRQLLSARWYQKA